MNESFRKEDVIDGSFPITWFIGENDTGDSNEDKPFNALAASKQGERFYRDQGWKTERIILKNYGHLLSENNIGMYGQLLNEMIPQKDGGILTPILLHSISFDYFSYFNRVGFIFTLSFGTAGISLYSKLKSWSGTSNSK